MQKEFSSSYDRGYGVTAHYNMLTRAGFSTIQTAATDSGKGACGRVDCAPGGAFAGREAYATGNARE